MRRLLASLAVGSMILGGLSGCGGGIYVRQGEGPCSPAEVVEAARSQLERPYHYGGSEPGEGFDCSGLAKWVYRQCGVNLPRQTSGQYHAGDKIAKNRLRPGDLVFFQIERPGPSHVGIYAGRGMFIHAPSTGGRVREDRITDSYWKKHFYGARRIL